MELPGKTVLTNAEPAKISWPLLSVLSVLAAFISIATQGFHPGVNNNSFHLPILLRLYDLPQFVDDAFVQSLRGFASFVYPLLSTFSDEKNAPTLLFALHVLTRALNILALVSIARCVMRADRSHVLLALAVIVLPGTLYGGSPLGAAGLFPPTFTHSELAQALGLFTLLAAAHGRFLLAAPLWALTFSLNAFVGAWCLLPLTFLALDFLRLRRAPVLRPLLLAAALAALLALPNLLWVLSFLRGQPPLDFDYVTFLREYFPNHFLIDAAKPRNAALLALHLAAAAASLWVLRWPRPWCLAFAGFLAVFLLGALAPFLTHSPTILNLHLLRVDGMLVLLGAAFCAAALPSLLLSPDPAARTTGLVVLPALLLGYWPAPATLTQAPILAAALLLLALATLLFYGTAAVRLARALLACPQPRRALSLLLFAASWSLLPFQRGRLLDPAPPTLLLAGIAGLLAWGLFLSGRIRSFPVLVAGFLLLFGIRSMVADNDSVSQHIKQFPTDTQLLGLNPAFSDWSDVASWARQNTNPNDVFLIPPSLSDFEHLAERQVWYNHKQGAAVMWMPRFYDQWKARRTEVSQLHGLADALAYACRRGISYVVADLRPGEFTTRAADGGLLEGRIEGVVPPPSPPVFSNRSFQVFRIASCV